MSSTGGIANLGVQHIAMADTNTRTVEPGHLTFLDKLAFWATCAATAAVFLTLGWMALAPEDPYGAVSLSGGGFPAKWIQAVGLAIVTSAFATIMLGRVLPYVGAFAAAFGLAALSIRGGTAESLIIAARTSGTSPGSLAWQMLVESIAWLAVLAIATAVAGTIARWFFSTPHIEKQKSPPSEWKLPTAAFSPIALAFALLAFNVLGAGMPAREIRHAQVCFVAAASIWFGCFVAFRIVPAIQFRWYIIPVALLPIAGYAWAMISSTSDDLPFSMPSSNFLRVLPVQFVSAAFAAAIVSYWSHLRYASGDSDSTHEQGSEAGDSA